MKLVIFKSPIQGRGVRTNVRLTKGTRVISMSGKRVTDAQVDRLYARGHVRLDDVFEIGNDQYLLLDDLPLAINHSCNPNCGLRGTNSLYALRALKPGDELTFDYSTVVGAGNAGWYMRCKCGARNCRSKVGNWQSLPPARLRYYARAQALPRFVVAELGLI